MGAKAIGKMNCDMAQRAIALAAMAASERDHAYAPHEAGSHFFRSALSSEPPSLDPLSIAPLSIDPLSPDASPLALDTAFHLPENPALAEHLRECRDCQAEMAATTAFFRALASESGPEPSATLLARARMRLDAELDGCARAGWWTRIAQQCAFTAGRLRAAPALCSALLLLGVVAGGYGGYRLGISAHAAEQSALLLAPPAPPEVPSVVADVTSVISDASSGTVQVRYDRLVPDVLTAPQNDPSIRELLMAAAENGVDPQVRDTSVSLLSGDCGPGSSCDGSAPVRNALLNALRTDKTPEVRREALAGLQPFLVDDIDVRDAVLGALLNDPSASVRIEAVRMLQGVDVDSSVRQALHAVATSDGDPTIRTASLAVLKNSPAVQ